MNEITQGDVLLFQTVNNGDILIENGLTKLSGGMETAAYLSLFGGNEDDAGNDNSSQEYWGNLDETNPAFKYRSETQNLLKSIPATSSNLNRIRDAVKTDLEWFVTEGVATEVDALVTIPGLNEISIKVTINAFGEESEFEFIENWKASI